MMEYPMETQFSPKHLATGDVSYWLPKIGLIASICGSNELKYLIQRHQIIGQNIWTNTAALFLANIMNVLDKSIYRCKKNFLAPCLSISEVLDEESMEPAEESEPVE